MNQNWCIKDDIDSYSRALKNGGEGEYVVRQLLEEHIRYITVIVKQINKDIEVLQDQIRTLDSGSRGTNNMVKTLEMRHLEGIGDLRGRVARCDASIAKLSADLVRICEGIQNLSNEQQRTKLTLEGKIKDVEGQISQLLKRIEESIREQERKIKLTMGQSSEQPHLLDVVMKNISEDFKGQVLSSSSRLEQELARKEQDLLHQIERLSLVMKDKTESSEKRLEERLNHLSVKFDKAEEIQKMKFETQGTKYLEKKLNAIRIMIAERIWKEIESIKAETNVGFTAVYESIGSLRQILEAKMKLDKEQLQKQILQVKQMINPVLTN
ncbi:protein FAM81A-like [Pristis pectinata]|uniref:protein FAM81A-like n=1 Tax=Pristis pectinata TaxID=685728 RepID=UPI00223E834C|nr:protein FAM81A-like [Pristis pectinata]XP_051896320.1 protein FAM81A-like [Pristis pectinata]